MVVFCSCVSVCWCWGGGGNGGREGINGAGTWGEGFLEGVRRADAFTSFACSRSKSLRLLTKGDNNSADDTELYARGQDYLDRARDVIGSVVGYIPFVGYVTILLSEHPWLKTAMLGLMGAMVLLQRE